MILIPVLLLLLLIGNVPAHTITEEELLSELILVSMNLRKSGKDIERLTTEYREDSLQVERRLLSIEEGLSEIESASGDMNQLEPEFEKQLTGLTTLFDEY